MIGSTRVLRVFAYGQPADMRKGFDGLYGLVSRDTQIPAVSGHPDSRTMTPRGVRCLGASLS